MRNSRANCSKYIDKNNGLKYFFYKGGRNMEKSLQSPINSKYGHKSTAMEIVNGLNISGKNVVITGGYAGTGLETTKALASIGANIIVLARDTKRAKINLKYIKNIEIEPFDLLKMETIDAFTAKYLATKKPVHILINHAGIINLPRLTKDSRGYEYQFATNHLGHFALTAKLFPALIKANGARIIEVSSRGHRLGGVIFDDINFEKTEYTGMKAYAQSKSANILFALKLNELAWKHNIRAFSVHPGPVPSSEIFAGSMVGLLPNNKISLMRLTSKIMRGLHVTEILNMLRKSKIKHEADLFKTIQQGAATTVWCAVNDDLNNIGGVYCEDCNVAKVVSADSNEPFGVRPWAIDTEAANRLWEISEKMTGIIFKI
jgi:NAD(P)-dependent dehydrogenase (short-subunit alcohol dehydrogenase family)